jgi:cytochrome c oxidase subunit 2
VAWQDAPEAWQMGFQDPATPVMQGIIDLHDDICFFLIVILSLVLWMLIRTLYFFHESQNPIPEKIIHGTSIEIAWTVAPSLILVLIAVPSLLLLSSFPLLYSMDQAVDQAIREVGVMGVIGVLAAVSFVLLQARRAHPERRPLFIIVIARRHYWMYIIFGPNGFGSGFTKTIYSRARPNNPGYVDYPLVVPYGRPIFFLVYGYDVRCPWRLRALGINLLAVPGNVDGRMVTIRPGTDRASPFSEAGYPHPNDRSVEMPIVVRAVTEPVFNGWYWSWSNQYPG